MGLYLPKDNFVIPSGLLRLNKGDPINIGAVAVYPLNRVEGTTVRDASGNAYNFATNGSPIIQPAGGMFNSALNLVSASSQWLEYNDSGNVFAFSNTTFSVSFWMKFPNPVSGNNLLVVKHGDSTSNTGWYFNLITTSDIMQMALRGSSGVTNCSSIKGYKAYANGQWHHVIGIFTTNTTVAANQDFALYLDTINDTGTKSLLSTYNAPDASIPLRIGARGAASPLYCNGQIAMVRIYNRALRADERMRLFLEPFAGFDNMGGVQALTLDAVALSGADATSFFDGKIVIKSSGTNLLDGKVQIKDVVTALLDGKVSIGSIQQDILDGKLRIKDTGISYLDGKVIVKDIATTLLDGKIEITQGGTDTASLDAKIRIKDALTALVDGKVMVKSTATDILDGKLTIGTGATNLLDGKIQIKDIATALIDGKIQVKSATVSLLDGKIVIADGVTSFSSNNQLLIDSIGGKVLQLGNSRLNTWNTAGRPSSPKNGTFGFNTQTVALEVWEGTAWKSVILS